MERLQSLFGLSKHSRCYRALTTSTRLAIVLRTSCPLLTPVTSSGNKVSVNMCMARHIHSIRASENGGGSFHSELSREGAGADVAGTSVNEMWKLERAI